MFTGRGVAIKNTGDADLLPGLLSPLSPPLRLVPFTSPLPRPPRRHPYSLVQTSAPSPLQGEHAVIDASGGGSQRLPHPHCSAGARGAWPAWWRTGTKRASGCSTARLGAFLG